MKKALLIAALSVSISMPVIAAEEAGVSVSVKEAVKKVAPVVAQEVKVAPKAEAGHDDHAKAQKPHWGYTGHGAAKYWGDMDASFELCGKGAEQSPINIAQYKKADLLPLNANYKPSPLEVVNNGHTVQVNYAPGSTLDIGGQSFDLLQFHFHTPSEHYMDGAPFPMEVHFVHQAKDGTLGVIGVMMKVGEHNPVIEGIWQNVPAAGGVKKVGGVELTATDLMPADKGYYKYAGSLTTPPCSEGVKWHVMRDPIEISQAQLVAFQSVFPVNARPIQGMGKRVVSGG